MNMNIAKLARLGVTAEADGYANDLSKILSMMDILAEVNTTISHRLPTSSMIWPSHCVKMLLAVMGSKSIID